MMKVFRFFFTIRAYLTFLFTLLFAFIYHVVVMVFTWGKGIELMYKCYKPWTYIWGFLNGIRYEIKGRENIRKGQPYVIVCNHGSIGDMFMLAAVTDLKFRPLGKIELTRIPLMGFMFKRALVLVDRSSPESRKKSILDMRKLIARGISILILPEGTRNRTNLPLKDFYDGAFGIAIETQVPIIPMVMLNTKKLYPNDEWLMNRIDLKCIFNTPVSTTGLTENDMKDLKEKVYNIMWNLILEEDELFKNSEIKPRQKSQDQLHHQTE